MSSNHQQHTKLASREYRTLKKGKRKEGGWKAGRKIRRKVSHPLHINIKEFDRFFFRGVSIVFNYPDIIYN